MAWLKITVNDGLKRMLRRLVETDRAAMSTGYGLEDLRLSYIGTYANLSALECGHPWAFIGVHFPTTNS